MKLKVLSTKQLNYLKSIIYYNFDVYEDSIKTEVLSRSDKVQRIDFYDKNNIFHCLNIVATLDGYDNIKEFNYYIDGELAVERKTLSEVEGTFKPFNINTMVADILEVIKRPNYEGTTIVSSQWNISLI